MAERMHECVFCKDTAARFERKRPQWIADLQVSTAIVCSNQICRAYTILIYNKAHHAELFQLERENQLAYMEDLSKVARAIYDAYRPHKMNYELLGMLCLICTGILFLVEKRIRLNCIGPSGAKITLKSGW